MTPGKARPSPAPQPNRKGPWSHAEQELVKRLYGQLSEAALARRLNRPLATLKKHLVEIFDKKSRQTGPWRPSEIEELKSLLGRASSEVIARRLRRAAGEIENRVALLRKEVREHPWSSEEKQQLKRDYGSRSDATLSLILAQPIASIQGMAQSLCLSKDKTFLHRSEGVERVRMPRWSAEELALLERLYPERRNEEIAQALNRSTKSVVSKAHDLGLKKTRERLREMGKENVSLRHQREQDGADGASGAEAAAE